MPVVTPPPYDGSGPRVITVRPPQIPKLLLLLLVPVALVLLGVCYWWFVQRVEVGPGEVLVLVRRVGAALPAHATAGKELSAAVREQVVLSPALLRELGEPENSNRYQGIKYEVQSEGRHFYDPFLWQRRIARAIVINQNEVGIQIRKYGKPLPPGKVVATTDDERGPLAEVLMPARYNINPFAYEVKRVPPIEIPPGFVGVQTLIHGTEPSNPNAWVVEEGERGVQPGVLTPALYYNNPYVRKIDLIDVRSHTLDLRGNDAIRFPSKDSFEITLEATVEYAIRQDMAPYVMVAIGDHTDIEAKLILPYARSLARIEGSKLLAREFISGEAREAFQEEVFQGLHAQCGAQGIAIRATPIRRIEPPAAIASPISDRQLADQQIKRYQNEMKVAESQARLVEQEELVTQNQAIGGANREVVAIIKQAEQTQAVALTEANKRHEVAKLQLQAAEEEAAAILSRGKAEADVILLGFKAEAEPLRDAIAAFGNGESYAQFLFYQKLGPSLKSILASTEGPFADIFRSLSEAHSSAPPGVSPAPPPREASGAAPIAKEGGEQ